MEYLLRLQLLKMWYVLCKVYGAAKGHGSITDTVLGPLLFSLYINDISSDIESEIRLFC